MVNYAGGFTNNQLLLLGELCRVITINSRPWDSYEFHKQNSTSVLVLQNLVILNTILILLVEENIYNMV